MKWLPGLPALFFATTSPLAVLAAPGAAPPSPTAADGANSTAPSPTDPAQVSSPDSAPTGESAESPPGVSPPPPSSPPESPPPAPEEPSPLAPPPTATEPKSEDQDTAPEVAPAPVSEPLAAAVEDTLFGHLRVGAAIYGTINGGDPSPPLNYGSTNSVGPVLDVGFGVSRNVALGLYGGLGWFSPGSNCDGCSLLAATGGAFVRYHLVQGLRLDPWISYGLGVRSLQITDDDEVSNVVALEWLRARIGTDWFLAKNVAIGPFLDLGLSSTLSAPRGDAGQVLWEVGLGFRLALDVGF